MARSKRGRVSAGRVCPRCGSDHVVGGALACPECEGGKCLVGSSDEAEDPEPVAVAVDLAGLMDSQTEELLLSESEQDQVPDLPLLKGASSKDSRRLLARIVLPGLRARLADLRPESPALKLEKVADQFDEASDLEEVQRIVSMNAVFSASVETIEEAISRMRDGTWGTCKVCGELIPLRRLYVNPAALTCKPCGDARPVFCRNRFFRPVD